MHTALLKERGFDALLEHCISQPVFNPTSRACLQSSCPGCDKHSPTKELYIPAPAINDIEEVFDHHITTRNVFAFIYNIPLAGRTLGSSMVALWRRLDQYRVLQDSALNKKEIIAFADSQKYLDYRECVDHALAALLVAEALRQDDMWIDSFSHAVGMSHRNITASLEYKTLPSVTQSLIMESRLEMDTRLARASMSLETFFGDDLSGGFLGLSQHARDHFDRFRSFLHSFYIETYGFWPPAGLNAENTRFSIYSALYSDFRNLYHHLVDPNSSVEINGLAKTGGVCTLQNIQAFDRRHAFDTLANPLPQLPQEKNDPSRVTKSQRRQSWNPVTQRKMERETRNRQRRQALIQASNRDVMLMACRLVRRYSEFEASSVDDSNEQISWIETRKVRWILIYAILQTLISIMAAPKHVRHTEGLTYSLCCNIPSRLPWAPEVPETRSQTPEQSEIVPDIDYLHLNDSTPSLNIRQSRPPTRKEQRASTIPKPTSNDTRSSSVPRVASLRRLLSRRRTVTVAEVPPVPSLKIGPHREIVVQGYGNGLNEVPLMNNNTMTLPSPEQMKRRSSLRPNMVPIGDIFQRNQNQRMPHDGEENHDLTASPVESPSVSRESSNASSNSSKSKSTTDSGDVPTPTDNKDMSGLTTLLHSVNLDTRSKTPHLYDEIDGLPGSIHINTETWDAILSDPRF